MDPAQYVELASKAAPFVDRAFVERVRERIRRLLGQWKGTPFHETMAGGSSESAASGHRSMKRMRRECADWILSESPRAGGAVVWDQGFEDQGSSEAREWWLGEMVTWYQRRSWHTEIQHGSSGS